MLHIAVFKKPVLFLSVLFLFLIGCGGEEVENTPLPPQPEVKEAPAVVLQATEPPVADSEIPEESTAVPDTSPNPTADPTLEPTSTPTSSPTPVGDSYLVNDASIQLSRPLPGETAVAGYPLYFAGSVENPVNDTMSIGVLIDGCTRFAAQQSFTVGGGSNWHGIVILPQLVEGDDACAVAYTGTFGEPDMRLVQLPLPILSPDDPVTPRIVLERGTDMAFVAGGLVNLAGTAVNADELEITLTSPDDGTILAQTTTFVGDYGLWQSQLTLPSDAPESIHINITILDETTDDPYTYTTPATVSP